MISGRFSVQKVYHRYISADAQNLATFFKERKSVVCITGAGISTESGIPDYRGVNGSYKKGHKPMVHSEFVSNESSRKRYWARSMAGYQYFSNASPNNAHYALSKIESAGMLDLIISQNVDGLHQQAGSKNVLNLHGRIDYVKCLSCKTVVSRGDVQTFFEEVNGHLLPSVHVAASHCPQELLKIRADGDMDLGNIDLSQFQVPQCRSCGKGVMKPDVVFFGDNVPKHDSETALTRVMESDGVLVVGSSLEVYSAYRLVRSAIRENIPVAIVNMGETRPERENMGGIVLKSEMNCSLILSEVAELLTK